MLYNAFEFTNEENERYKEIDNLSEQYYNDKTYKNCILNKNNRLSVYRAYTATNYVPEFYEVGLKISSEQLAALLASIGKTIGLSGALPAKALLGILNGVYIVGGIAIVVYSQINIVKSLMEEYAYECNIDDTYIEKANETAIVVEKYKNKFRYFLAFTADWSKKGGIFIEEPLTFEETVATLKRQGSVYAVRGKSDVATVALATSIYGITLHYPHNYRKKPFNLPHYHPNTKIDGVIVPTKYVHAWYGYLQ